MEEVNKRVIFTELVEAEILIHQEPIWAAQRASGGGQHRIPNYDEIVDWPILAMMLKAVGFDTLSFFGWFGSTSLGALCTLHPLPRPCLHARGGVTLADVTAGCCSHLP